MAEKQQKKAWKKAPQQGNLAQALQGWSNISQKIQEEKPTPPDQKILNDIKGLLSELKFKLDELSFVPTPPEKTPEVTAHASPTETLPRELD